MYQRIRKFWREERGEAVEQLLLIAAIVGLAGVFLGLGEAVQVSANSMVQSILGVSLGE